MDKSALEQLYDAIKLLSPVVQERKYISPQDEGMHLKKFSLLKEVPIEYAYGNMIGWMAKEDMESNK